MEEGLKPDYETDPRCLSLILEEQERGNTLLFLKRTPCENLMGRHTIYLRPISEDSVVLYSVKFLSKCILGSLE